MRANVTIAPPLPRQSLLAHGQIVGSEVLVLIPIQPTFPIALPLPWLSLLTYGQRMALLLFLLHALLTVAVWQPLLIYPGNLNTPRTFSLETLQSRPPTISVLPRHFLLTTDAKRYDLPSFSNLLF